MRSILQGIRVLDFTRYTAGSFSTRWLTDLGAEVAKVEPPGGEQLRQDGFARLEDGSLVPMLYPENPAVGGFAPMFMYNNAGKKSICIDMRLPESQELIKRLVAKSDVVVESFTPHVFKNWGLTYEELRKIKPDIILVSASGFGHDYPDSRRVCTEPIAMAMSGFVHMNGEPDGYPLNGGTGIGDPVSATVAALAVLAAVIHKLRTGEGQFVDTAMVDSILALDCCAVPYVAYSRGEYQPIRGGRHNPVAVPMGIFKAREGYVAINAHGNGPNSGWGRLCRLMGREDLITDPEWAMDETRRKKLDKVWQLIEAWLQERFPDAEAAAEEIAARQIVIGKVNSPNEAVSDPHYERRRMVVEVNHPLLGDLPITSTPIKFSRTPIRVGRTPFYGEHNEDVLSNWLGFGQGEVAELYGKGVLLQDELVGALRASGELADPWRPPS